MWTRQHKQTKYRPADRSGRIGGASCAYFGFHAYHGEFGIYSKYQLESAAVDCRRKLDADEGRPGGAGAARAASA